MSLAGRVGAALRALRRPAAGVDPWPPAVFDSLLAHAYGETLEALDSACAGGGPEALELFRPLDDDLWAILLTRRYSLYPEIRALLPAMPDPALQLRWNGATGPQLLDQSRAFYSKAKALWSRHAKAGVAPATILDFGCGWGRLTRYFARDVPPGSLFGCDPVEQILEVCRETRVPAILARSEFVPDRLPFEESFDLVFAFSVFTHLSEPAHRSCLAAIHASLAPEGLLIATIRPPAYLFESELMEPLRSSVGPDPLAALAEPRYLFVAHEANRWHPQFDPAGMSYGETVISLPYIRERWAPLFELLEVSVTTADPHQVVITLRRRD